MGQWAREERIVGWAGMGLLVLALVIYLCTLDSGLEPRELEGGDLITHQYAQVQARPSNAPGYPLYTMGGWLWFHGGRTLLRMVTSEPINPMLILSSYSMIWAFLALWLLYKILCFVTRTTQWPYGNWPLAWLATLFYSVTYFFWYYATTTEQYSSAVAHTLAIVYFGLRFLDRTRMSADERGKESMLTRVHPRPKIKQLYTLALLCGLILAHMLTVAFIVPPLLLVIFWQMPSLLTRIKIVVTSIIMAATPLISYIYVYLRGASHPEWRGGEWASGQGNTWDWFWWFLSTPQGREELGWGLEQGRAFWGNGFPELIWQELSIPIFVLGLIGLVWLGWQRAIFFYGTLLIYAVFCWAYRYGNWFQVILPAYPIIIIGATVCLHRLSISVQKPSFSKKLGFSAQQKPVQNPRSSAFIRVPYLKQTLPIIFLAIAIVWRVQASLPEANSRNRLADSGLDRATLLLSQPLPQKAALFADKADAHSLQYLLDIWQIAPAKELQVVSSQEAAQHLNHGGLVLSTLEMVPTLRTELPQAWLAEERLAIQSGSPAWVQWQLDDAKHESVYAKQPSLIDAVVLGAADEPELVLHSYRAAVTRTNPRILSNRVQSSTLDVMLYWQIPADGWPADLAISVRPTQQGAFLSNQEGGIIQADRSAPLQGLWEQGMKPIDELLADGYQLPFNDASPDGLMVIVYRATESDFENLVELQFSLGMGRK